MSTNTETVSPEAIDTALADAYRRQSVLATRVKWDPSVESELDAVSGEVVTLMAQYTGWSRFFLVQNHGGHIHSSMHCSTCRFDTRFGWLPSVSGRTEADAVAEFGEILCSVCFPSAPVAWTTGVAKSVQSDRDAKAVAKAERDAKRLAAALLPDGTPLRVQRDSLKTLRSAQMWLTDSFSWNRSYPKNGQDSHPSYPLADVNRVAAAIAAKTGQDADTVLTVHRAKAAKRDGVNVW